MADTFPCPWCQTSYPCDPRLVGKPVRCRACKYTFQLQTDGTAIKIRSGGTEKTNRSASLATKIDAVDAEIVKTLDPPKIPAGDTAKKTSPSHSQPSTTSKNSSRKIMPAAEDFVCCPSCKERHPRSDRLIGHPIRCRICKKTFVLNADGSVILTETARVTATKESQKHSAASERFTPPPIESISRPPPSSAPTPPPPQTTLPAQPAPQAPNNSIHFACPSCGENYPRDPRLVDKAVRCRSCKQSFVLKPDGSVIVARPTQRISVEGATGAHLASGISNQMKQQPGANAPVPTAVAPKPSTTPSILGPKPTAFDCPHCGVTYPFREDKIGIEVRCTTCRGRFFVQADGIPTKCGGDVLSTTDRLKITGGFKPGEDDSSVQDDVPATPPAPKPVVAKPSAVVVSVSPSIQSVQKPKSGPAKAVSPSARVTVPMARPAPSLPARQEDPKDELPPSVMTVVTSALESGAKTPSERRIAAITPSPSNSKPDESESKPNSSDSSIEIEFPEPAKTPPTEAPPEGKPATIRLSSKQETIRREMSKRLTSRLEAADKAAAKQSARLDSSISDRIQAEQQKGPNTGNKGGRRIDSLRAAVVARAEGGSIKKGGATIAPAVLTHEGHSKAKRSIYIGAAVLGLGLIIALIWLSNLDMSPERKGLRAYGQKSVEENKWRWPFRMDEIQRRCWPYDTEQPVMVSLADAKVEKRFSIDLAPLHSFFETYCQIPYTLIFVPKDKLKTAQDHLKQGIVGDRLTKKLDEEACSPIPLASLSASLAQLGMEHKNALIVQRLLIGPYSENGENRFLSDLAKVGIPKTIDVRPFSLQDGYQSVDQNFTQKNYQVRCRGFLVRIADDGWIDQTSDPTWYKIWRVGLIQVAAKGETSKKDEPFSPLAIFGEVMPPPPPPPPAPETATEAKILPVEESPVSSTTTTVNP